MLPHHSAKTSDSRMPANITKSKHSRSRSSSRCHAAAYCSRPTVNFSADSLASFTGAFRPSLILGSEQESEQPSSLRRFPQNQEFRLERRQPLRLQQ